MAGERASRTRWTVLAVTILLIGSATAGAVVTPRAVIVVPFDASSLAADDQWIGEGVAQLLSLGLAWHPGFVQIDRRGLDTWARSGTKHWCVRRRTASPRVPRSTAGRAGSTISSSSSRSCWTSMPGRRGFWRR
jgi:hypothetical protein